MISSRKTKTLSEKGRCEDSMSCVGTMRRLLSNKEKANSNIIKCDVIGRAGVGVQEMECQRGKRLFRLGRQNS